MRLVSVGCGFSWLAPAWNGYDAFLNESQFWVSRRNNGTTAFDYTLEVRPSDYFGQVDEKIQPVITLTPVRGTIGVIYTMSLNGTMYSITAQTMQSGVFTLFNNTANTPVCTITTKRECSRNRIVVSPCISGCNPMTGVWWMSNNNAT